jgi:hypothetical protein
LDKTANVLNEKGSRLESLFKKKSAGEISAGEISTRDTSTNEFSTRDISIREMSAGDKIDRSLFCCSAN